MTTKTTAFQRVLSLLLCVALLAAYLPASFVKSSAATQSIITVADPETLTRPGTIYGDSTVNTGKITVGKSVSTTGITVNGQKIDLTDPDNFLITISQAAQTMGLTTETSAPVDVVFVLDTSNSMAGTKVTTMVTEANNAIATLMAANENNRVAVVAFSGGNGGGTSNGAHASVLSYLDHYDGDAATNHIQWVNQNGGTTGNRKSYIMGRGDNAGIRAGTSTGTNIHAGVALGGSLLADVPAADTKVNGVTRIPFLVIMSDGDPTLAAGSSDSEAWYDPSLTSQLGSVQETDGLGFLAALTAAYYKGKITEKYFGTSADANNHCFVYTMGLGLSADGLGEMTMDPSGATNNNYSDEFEAYWSKYEAGANFTVRVSSRGTYTITANSIAASEKYVYGTGLGYSGSYQYNDAYFSASAADDLQAAFADIVTEISKKAISSPTKVTTGDHNFDGYVNFYDPIGEYMEVKDMKGIVANGYFYQGASFAKYLQSYGTANANEEFDAMLRSVLKTRMGLSSADDRFASEAELDAFIDQLLISARNSENQANYTSNSNFDNSIVWWGNAYDSGEEDEHVQLIGFADNDTIDYITSTTAPEGADYVCRSYFFYGEAGGAVTDPDHQYLYFVVRVQRELVAPYRETVVISAPASLLSVEKVLINESFDDNGNPVYTATVEHQLPARVVYEVGLWDEITPENVSFLVSQEYAEEYVNGTGSSNYDPLTKTYHFFTNDWDRSESLGSHHRGMAKATFDAAADNPFYTYQADTCIVDKNGNPVTSDPRGTTAYYVREYYEWSDNNQDGTYTATKKTKLIEIDVPSDANLVQKNGQWFIPKGAYTGATLVVNGDDTEKTENITGTSAIVAHPHRTGASNNSHYTVLLGNNGKLSLTAEPYEPKKTVSVNTTEIRDDNGKLVQVGDILTYTVEAKNILPYAADIVITDYIPMGTAFVPGSAGEGIAPDSNNVLTWTLSNVPAGETRTVSFRVEVTKAALSQNVVADTIRNAAQVKIGNSATVSTNTTSNPPYGKTVTGINGADADGKDGYKVGDILVYHIRVANNTAAAADVTVTDVIPQGTEYVEDSADNGGVHANGTVTWQFEKMPAGAVKVVSFQVKITAAAQAEDGQITLENTAQIQVGNNPQITTNTTINKVDLGDMVISKLVAAGGDTSKTFTIRLTETTGMLNGSYVLTGGNASTVAFVNGEASVTIKHGQTLTIQDLPAGIIITVSEDVSQLPGWTPAYNTQSVTITKGAATAVSSVSITNHYSRQSLTMTLQGVKVMEGTALPSGVTFGFIAVPDSANPVVGDPLTGEVTVNGAGTYEFTLGTKTFTQPGVYKYTISEIDGGVMGVHYDGTAYELVINVTDNGDGTMNAAATLNGKSFDVANGKVTFTNTYAPAETQLEITAKKELTGRELIAGEFSFQLTDGTSTYKGIMGADGNILFETMVFTKAGTYTYTMSEIMPGTAAQGMSYDTKTYTVTVEVIDRNGQLVTEVTVDGTAKTAANGIVDSGVTFRNAYTPDDAPLTLVAKKTLMAYNVTTGKYESAQLTAGAFSFKVVDADGNTVTTGSNAADGTITFNTFYFSAAMLEGAQSKTFTYTISEVVPQLTADPNMKYDLEGKQITVTLSKTAAGKLVVTVGGDSDGVVDLTGAANFINYGNPTSVTVIPTGKKTTTGGNLPAGLSFSFQVLPVDGTVNAATGTSAVTKGGSDSETSDITFTAMVYTHAHLGDAATKTYRYWIMESNAGAGDNGVTYDKTRYLYQVTLSRDEFGRLIAQEQYFALKDGGNAETAADYTVEVTNVGISFHNTYAAKAHINLSADKVLTGRELHAGEFDFVLHRLDTTGKLVAGSEITGSNDAAGVIHFATLNYSDAMLTDAYKHDDGAYYFSYLMQEIRPEGVVIPGVTYDATEYVVTIQVTQTTEGMTAKLAGVSKAAKNGESYQPGESVSGFTAAGDTNVTFTNAYQAVEGDVVKYQIQKVLNGRPIRPGEFKFGLFLNGELVAEATNDANGIVTFTREIPATAAGHAGVYEMVIRELPGNVPGVTYSAQEYTVYVKVTDDNQGKIHATVHLTENGEALPENAEGVVDLTGEFIFTNTYAPNGTHYTPEARKELTGRELIAGEFSFQAQLIRKDGSAVSNGAVYAGVNDGAGKIFFEQITFAEVGTYIYKITETKGTISGVAYDEGAYYLKVEVTDAGNGQLEAQASYHSDAACQKDAVAIFRNTYTPDDLLIQLEANKVLNGRDMEEKEFSFVVRKDNKDGKIVATGSNDAAGKILFSTFDITAADLEGAASKTFTYVIMESDNLVPGVQVDKNIYEVTVTVTNRNGVLSAEIVYPDNKPITFTNTYAAAPVELPLTAFKELTGKNLADNAFTFQLKSGDKVIQEVQNAADGTISFRNLVFTEAGTYRYTLSEVQGSDRNMTYDTTVYTITVTVTDDGKGSLHAQMKITADNRPVELMTFRNVYTPAKLELELEGTKIIVDEQGNVLTGPNYALDGFRFQVYDAKGKYICDATSDANGKIVFEGFAFTEAGEYRFLISEKTTDRPGYTTDPTVWCVHITIGYDADKGLLEKTGELVHVAPENHDEVITHTSEELTFVNVYKPAQAELILQGVKVLDGRQLREHEFLFYMVDKATNLRAAESRNHGDGKINFHLTYTKAGTYTYIVYEHIPEQAEQLGGVAYDNTRYEVVVAVTDDGSGKLDANVTQIRNLSDPDKTGVSVQFNNTYKPGAAQATIEAWKSLEGRDLKTGEFTFQLVNQADTSERYTATNAANGNVTFQTLVYDQAGIYVYTLSEVQDNVPGVTYDQSSYEVTVTVTDDGNGQLSAAVSYGDIEGMPTFHNTYEAKSVSYTPEVRKIFEGGKMMTFDFVLSGAGFETQTKQNDETGAVTFDALTFTAAGTYTFTISEKVNAAMEDIKWDTNVYTLTIQVVDNGKGQLVIEDVAITSELGRTDLVFRNVHEDLITDKDVFRQGDMTVSIDGKAVEKGDVLTYTITYKNFTGKTIDITITDATPEGTAYIAGSATNGGSFADGLLTWNIAGIAPDATVTVRFDVVVVGGQVVENQAQILEGENTYTTNIITNTVQEDTIVKDVFSAEEPTVRIDGQTVRKGDVLIYRITYTNADDFAADVTITDRISQYALYIPGSADNGGSFADGVLTWNLKLAAGESVTVSFQAQVIGTNVAVQNQATAVEGENEIHSNIVRNPVPEDDFRKDVFLTAEPSISVDGMAVKPGDILTYQLTYSNSFEAAADVTLTDIIPAGTMYVDGSADHGGIFANGKLVWNLKLEASERITVTFQVQVLNSNITVVNQATAIEGKNVLESNAVQTYVPEDLLNKDVFLAAKPNISIDGKAVQIGDILTYQLTYTNSYEAAADVTIADMIPDNTVYLPGSADCGGVFADGKLVWNVKLAAGERIVVTFQVMVTQSNVTITNQAVAIEGENKTNSNIVTNLVPQDSFQKDVFLTAEPAISVDGKAVKAGDILTYQLTYTNSYEAAADVTIMDSIPANTIYVDGSADHGAVFADNTLTWSFHLAAGESVTVSFQVQVVGSNAAITNQATALEGENKMVSNVVQIQTPEDSFHKDVVQSNGTGVSVDGKAVQVGDVLIYKLTYHNSYEAAADVTITDTIPANTIYVDGSADNGGIFADGKLVWNLKLAAGESITVSFQVQVIGANVTLQNQATAVEGENVIQSNIVRNPVPEDHFQKDVFLTAEPSISVDGKAVQVGDVLTYQLTYSNSFEAAADVTLTDIIPAGTMYVDGSADHGGIFADGKLVWNLKLAAGESITVSFQVQVVGSNATITNQAVAIEGENKLESNAVQTYVPEDHFQKDVFHTADISISVDGKAVQVGDVLIYKLTYQNSYEAAADVTIVDTIPNGTIYVADSADNGGIFENGQITWNVHLAAGESITVSFQVQVAKPNVTVSNQAIAIEGENKLESNCTETLVPQDEIVKDVALVGQSNVSIDGQKVKTGDVLIYSITYTNSYESAADVTIVDKLSEYVTYLEGSADHGGVYADGEVRWNVTLEAGQSITVTFRVKVKTTNVTLVNQAIATEGESKVESNIVENPVRDSVIPNTGDHSMIGLYALLMIASSGAILTLVVVDRKRKNA